jgi:hypothetical protein
MWATLWWNMKKGMLGCKEVKNVSVQEMHKNSFRPISIEEVNKSYIINIQKTRNCGLSVIKE